jgi:hypothetical protein
MFVLAAAPAQADITVTNVKAAPADTKAGGHSDFTLSFDLGGSESIKDLDVNLPAGLLGNPNNAARCTQAQFDSDSCPAESQVGTQTVNVTVFGALPSDASGVVYNLVPPADKPEPAQLGIKLTPQVGPTQHLRSDVIVRPSDSGLTSTIRDIPNTISGLPIHINSISLTLSAQSGSKKPFMTNPTSCGPANTTLHVVGDGAGTADGQGGFTPTACDQLPFAPKLSATVGETGQTKARSMPPLTTVIEQAPGEAATKSARVTLLTPLSPNVGALANVCSVADFDADKCPAKSVVGQATAVTPLLATPLKGPVRIVENPGNLPKLVLYLNGLINIRLVGNIQLAAAGTETTFAGIPDVPLTRFQLDFTSGASGLVGTIEDLCTHTPSIKGEFTAHSGKTTTVTSPATVNGCPNGVVPPPAKNPRPVGAASLRGLATSKPVLKASVKRRTGGKRIRALSISLPSGLSFDRGTLKVTVLGTSKILLPVAGKRRIVLRTKSVKGAASLAATVKPGLVVSKGLRSRVKRHPKVTVVLRATDVSGKTFTLRKRVPVR